MQATKVRRDHGCRKTLAGTNQKLPAAEIDQGSAEVMGSALWFLRAQNDLRVRVWLKLTAVCRGVNWRYR